MGLNNAGFEGIGCIEFVEFLGFFVLMKRERVGCHHRLAAIDNSINTTNPMNKATMFVRFKSG